MIGFSANFEMTVRHQGIIGRMDKLDWKTAGRVLFDWKVWIW